MSVLTELFEKMDATLANAKSLAAEFEGGKKLSAPLLRKVAQDGRNLWVALRVETMNMLKAMPTKKRAPKVKETPTV